MAGKTTEQRNKSCAERIEAQRDGRLEDWRELFALEASDDDEKREEAFQQLDEYPLSVELRRTVRIDLSTGGPGDWLEVQLDHDGDPGRIEYHFNDWFDHAAVTLEGEDYEIAERFARYVTADFYFSN